eukprot:365617-Chlamydomonas_euryale.AAC.9
MMHHKASKAGRLRGPHKGGKGGGPPGVHKRRAVRCLLALSKRYAAAKRGNALVNLHVKAG